MEEEEEIMSRKFSNSYFPLLFVPADQQKKKGGREWRN